VLLWTRSGRKAELTVMRRVFDGGVGSIRPGRSERSRESDGEWRVLEFVLDERDMGGVLNSWDCIVGDAACVWCSMMVMSKER